MNAKTANRPKIRKSEIKLNMESVWIPIQNKPVNALMTIPATSVESERAFSAAGLFVSKLRTSLSDKSVDMLCFMRSHMLKK